MKFLATKNNHKKSDKHPDFRIYLKDEEGNIVEEEYTKQDGTKAIGWKSFGAMWHSIEGGKIKSSTIDIDIEAVNALNQPKDIDQELQDADKVFDEIESPF